MNDIILKPRLSEKAYGLSKARNNYVFEVPKNANKLTIANAVATQFEVTVEGVNVANVKGKSTRTFINRRGKFVRGTRSNIKKAYVTLKVGDNIPIFAAEEEAEAKEAKATAKAVKKTKKDKK